jgi:hypothetical protein
MDEIDISPYSLRDEFSLNEAAYLWAGLLPTMRISERKAYPAKMAAAREWGRVLVEAAKKGDLHVTMPPEGTKTTSQMLTAAVEARNNRVRESLGSWEWTTRDSSPRFGVHRRDSKPPEPPWSLARASRAQLKSFAQSLGQRPAFLFHGDASEKAEAPAERNRRVAAAVLDGTMTRAQAEAEGIKPDNLKRILAAERKRRAGTQDGEASPSGNEGNPKGPWELFTTNRPQAGIAKPSPKRKAAVSKT